jgi:hypothetical protein
MFTTIESAIICLLSQATGSTLKKKNRETIVELSFDVASRHKREQNFQHEKRVNSQVCEGRRAACAEISQRLKKTLVKKKSLGFTTFYCFCSYR